MSPSTGPEEGGGGRSAWVRRKAEPGESLLAAGVALAAAAAVGGAVLYLARMFISREELRMEPRAEEEVSGG